MVLAVLYTTSLQALARFSPDMEGGRSNDCNLPLSDRTRRLDYLTAQGLS
jgi:hypothetical protein